ncbi:MAG: CheR family methyltransferase [Rhodothermales bacterium]|nr:CheR family methyltransferase [Rhodothermales bacterium]
MESHDKSSRPPLELVANHLFTPVRPQASVVAVAVSPSGYDALRAFFKALPASCRTPFIVLSSGSSPTQRLDESLLGVTPLETVAVKNKEKLRQACIYLVPQGKHIVVRDGILQTVAPASLDTSQLPLDAIFRSFAEREHTQTITLLFNDAFADGLAGLKQLRSAGGVIFQATGRPIAPDDALALEARTLVDAVVSPQQMATLLAGYLKGLASAETARPVLWRDEREAQLLEQVFALLEKQYAINFGVYKPAYLETHFAQRMRIHQVGSLSQYIGILKSYPAEVGFLAKRLLFRNASFYKPNRIFQRLKETLLHRIMEMASTQGTCRIWVPECASGEEALMFAILLQERAAKQMSSMKLQIIATDSDTETLAFARKGIYGLGIASHLPALYLDRFFRREGEQYTVAEDLQKIIHFFSHNPMLTPPLNGLHAIYASEVLSRLSEAVASEVVNQFSEALAPGGFLLLDQPADEALELPGFIPVSGSTSVFQKKSTVPLFAATPGKAETGKQEPAPPRPSAAIELLPTDTADEDDEGVEIDLNDTDLTVAEPAEVKVEATMPVEAPKEIRAGAPEEARSTSQDEIQDQANQPSLLVDAEGRILDQFGPIHRFLDLPGDSLRVDLIDLVIPDIRADLKAALEQAIQRNKTFKSKAIPFEINGETRPVHLQIRPVPLNDGATMGAQVTFFDATIEENESTDMESNKSVTHALESMENDLAQLKTRLHAMLHDLQNSRDEVRAENAAIIGQADDLRRQISDMTRRNEDLTDTNKELLALNRDLVKKVEEMRRGLQQAARRPEPAPEPEHLLKTPLGGLLSKRHEIRTALTSIIGFADLLADRLRDENRELAQYVGAGGKQLSDALSVLLNQDDEAPAPPPTIKVQEIKLTPIRTARLLVVDDSDDTRRLLALVLGDRFECEMASSASEAIEKANLEYFTAVLLDINLGKDASGVDVLHQLRTLQHYQNVPFMAVTAMATPRDRALLLREGFDAYLPKPFHKTALLNTLDQILSQKSMN